jgi:outer membrane protein OmpA-like peptidoglycan-associated protein
MRKTITAISLLALLATSSSFAGTASKKESAGVGAGGVIGAIAGGPVGFIIGAAIGAKVGDTMHKKTTTIDELTVSLDDSQRIVSDLERDVQTLGANADSLGVELDRMREFDRPQLINLLQAGIAMDLLFRTDEHSLADMTGSRLAQLAGSLASMPDIRVQLDGFADERGDTDYNQDLSRKRVEFVRDQLISAGVHPTRISVSAHGEAPAQDDTVDSYALERRVSLKLFIENSPSVAANAN